MHNPSSADTEPMLDLGGDQRLLPEFPEQLSRRARMVIHGESHPGKVRKNNEDHFLVADLGRWVQLRHTNLPAGLVPDSFQEHGYTMVVADGMGGMAAGEVASQFAIRMGVALVLNDTQWGLKIDDQVAQKVLDKMAERFRLIHQALNEKARRDLRLSGMGTTLTAAYVVGMDLFIVHVGDSRAYLLTQGKLQQITRDHTLAARMVEEGKLKREEVGQHRLRHVLTQAIGGTEGQIEAEVHRVKLQDGDRLLLCSDGLSDLVDENTLQEILRQTPEPQQACVTLRDLALDRGGKDNITVIVGDFSLASS